MADDPQFHYIPFVSFDEWSQVAIDQEAWDAYTSLLMEHRAGADPEVEELADEFVKRAAAFDSGALEGLYTTDRGFTVTVASRAAGWESQVEARSSTALGHFSAQLSALDLVLDAATGSLPIGEAFIRSLHEACCRAQATYQAHSEAGVIDVPLPKGEYKTNPNHVMQQDGTPHAYAPVADTGPEMHRLVEELGAEQFGASHPAVQAAYAHYALTAIHPFADGNGRVARALASVYLYRALSLPLVVLISERDAYLDALSSADDGSPETFVAFVVARVVDAVVLTTDELARPRVGPPAAESIARLSRLLRTEGELTHVQRDDLVNSLIEDVTSEFDRQVRELGLPNGTSASARRETKPLGKLPEGFQAVVSHATQLAALQIVSDPPAKAKERYYVYPLIRLEQGNLFPFRLYAARAQQHLDVRLAEVHPQRSEAFRLRLEAWVKSLVAGLAASVVEQAAHSLRAAGYEDSPSK